VSREHMLVTTVETKVQMHLPSEPQTLALRALVELMPQADVNEVSVRRLEGVEALRACMRNTNATGIAGADGRGKAFFDWVTTLAHTVPIYQLTRPLDGWSLETVLEHIQALASEYSRNEAEQ